MKRYLLDIFITSLYFEKNHLASQKAMDKMLYLIHLLNNLLITPILFSLFSYSIKEKYAYFSLLFLLPICLLLVGLKESTLTLQNEKRKYSLYNLGLSFKQIHFAIDWALNYTKIIGLSLFTYLFFIFHYAKYQLNFSYLFIELILLVSVICIRPILLKPKWQSLDFLGRYLINYPTLVIIFSSISLFKKILTTTLHVKIWIVLMIIMIGILLLSYRILKNKIQLRFNQSSLFLEFSILIHESHVTISAFLFMVLVLPGLLIYFAFEVSRNYSYLFKDSIRYCILFWLLFTAIGSNNSFLSTLTSFDLEAKRMIQLQHFGHFLQEKFIRKLQINYLLHFFCDAIYFLVFLSMIPESWTVKLMIVILVLPFALVILPASYPIATSIYPNFFRTGPFYNRPTIKAILINVIGILLLELINLVVLFQLHQPNANVYLLLTFWALLHLIGIFLTILAIYLTKKHLTHFVERNSNHVA
ncbi:hypothetical protein CIRMBP1247_01161 [Enterococcus cecorum]|nr:hypothetical protein CIRMBP1247_01161 [Enterococcus cecorum]